MREDAALGDGRTSKELAELLITAEDLQVATEMVTDLEPEMSQVFKKIGRTDSSLATDRFVEYLARRGECPYAEAYRYIHAQFPQFKEFEDMLKGLIQAGFVGLTQLPDGNFLLKSLRSA